MPPSPPDLDYRRAFQDAPVGLAIGHHRVIAACNRAFMDIFRGDEADLLGRSFEALYPSAAHFGDTGERVGRRLAAERSYADDRVMQRLTGQHFWVHVRGYTYTPQDPHRDTLWVFTELSTRTSAQATESLTPRERDVASLLTEGKTGKEVALALGISPRTVDIYRTRLLRKFHVASTAGLVQRLLMG